MKLPLEAARHFNLAGSVIAVQPLGAGNINDTYLIITNGVPPHAVLQRINREVFPQPDLIMHNLRVVTDHLLRHPQLPTTSESGRRWEVTRPFVVRDDGYFWRDGCGDFWRLLSFVENAAPLTRITHSDQAKEIGIALGYFHALIADLPIKDLLDPLHDLHMTPRYLAHYDEVRHAMLGTDTPEKRLCSEAIEKHRPLASVLEEARRKKILLARPIHGDPKLDNFLFDRHTRQAVALIDLDTVKPGLILWDLGDCLRSCCNPGGEDPAALTDVRFDPELCRVILQGYCAAAPKVLTAADCDYLLDAIRLIPFELGMRFFTDFLEDNRYFKVRDPEHSLRRALAQFRLLEEIEKQQDYLIKMIKDLRKDI